MTKRVVITGVGVMTPLGMDKEILWENLIQGKSGAGPITAFDVSQYDSKIGCEVKDFEPEKYLSAKDVRKKDRFLHFAMASATEALKDSGIEPEHENPYRFGVIIGSGIGGMISIQAQHKNLLERGPDKVSPFFIPMTIINMASGEVAIKFGMKGPNYSIVSACASGAHSIGAAFDAIRYGKADLMLTGGTEATITPMGVAGFCSMKALSTRNDEPEKASRPFDKTRDGFVIGEGSGVMMLEELERAKARGAKIYAEIAGFGATADAYHITFPDPEGLGGMNAMKAAIQDAGIKPEQIDYINTHGTSTPVGDKIEALAIKKLFGEKAPQISSTKSMTGHLLGAAGAVESIICALTTMRGIIPPTINYEFPDPECDLDVVPNLARQAEVEYALNNSFGFGGQNAAIIIKRYRG